MIILYTIHIFARLNDIDQDDPDNHGDAGSGHVIDNRSSAKAAQLPDMPQLGDTGNHRCDHKGHHHHEQRIQEYISQESEFQRGMRGIMSKEKPDNDRQDYQVKVYVRNLSFFRHKLLIQQYHITGQMDKAGDMNLIATGAFGLYKIHVN